MTNEFPYGLFVLRHCRTDYNSNHKISGQSNPNLLDFSINTDSLNINNIQYQDLEIITSPLARCLQTIYLLQKQSGDLNLNIRVDSRIIERGMGIWEGRFKADILQKFPECCYQGHIIPYYTPPCGETLEHFSRRIDDFISDLKMSTQRAPILICAHNQSLKFLKYRLTGAADLLNFWLSTSFQNGKVERIC